MRCLWWNIAFSKLPKKIKNYKCDSCGFLPKEQKKRRREDIKGLCRPGRCVVNGLVWLVWPDGSPLDL